MIQFPVSCCVCGWSLASKSLRHSHRTWQTPLTCNVTRSLDTTPNIEAAISSSLSSWVVLARRKHSRSQSSNTWLERQRKDPYVIQAQDQGLPSRAYFKLQEINEIHYAAVRAKGNKKSKEMDALPAQHHTTSKRKALIQPDYLVLDLGAAPGGWSLYSSAQLNPNLGGALVAVDLLPLDETLHSRNIHTDISSKICANLQSNFYFIQGDFMNHDTRNRISSVLKVLDVQFVHRQPDIVLSDMAANFTGDSLTDAIRTLNLCEEALAFVAGRHCFDPSLSSTHDHGGSGVLKDGGAFLCKYFECGNNHEADFMNAIRRVFTSFHIIKPNASRKESREKYLLALDYKGK